MAKQLKILFVTSEVTPLAKTGGMADVCDAIPKYLVEAGHDVDVIVPFYRAIRQMNPTTETLVERFTVPLGEAEATGAITTMPVDRPWRALLVENDSLYDREGLYTDPATGMDYPDNAKRFAFFAKAALAAMRALGKEYDIVHTHDWQGGLVVSQLRHLAGRAKALTRPATVITIHNIGYKGLFPPEAGAVFGLPPERFVADGHEYFGQWSLLKGGLLDADLITTVSTKYAKEIQTPEFGFGFEGLLEARADRLVGITHGVDYAEWDPAADPYIAANYGPDDMAGKARCKADLLATFGISADWIKKPVIAFIGRLVEQKGLELILPIVQDILAHGYQLLFLGEGAKKYEAALRDLQHEFPDSIGVHVGFSEQLAHKIEAGADLLLLPSIYEPCGLSQMYSQKYGTLPVVRATGGLDDTVKGWKKGRRRANGFKFAEKSSETLLHTLADAAMLFDDKTKWNKLVANAMAEENSWPNAIGKYERAYSKAIRLHEERAKAK